jgi:hypothetical protein
LRRNCTIDQRGRVNQLAPDRASSNLTELKTAATKFRLAIERCDRRRLICTFQDFPKGSCGDASLLLRAFLQEQGLGTFGYMLGWRESDSGRSSHAWLETGGVIVDITADQFPEIDERIIVTENSAWHAGFELDDAEQVSDYRRYDASTVAELDSSYGIILAKFERL